MAARLPSLAVAVLCAALGIYLAGRSGGEARLARANAALLAGDHARALVEIDGATGTLAERAHAVRGYAHFARGRYEPARAAFREAVLRDPNNWVLRREYAVTLLRLGDRVRAQAMMRSARALNPRMPLPAGFQASR